MFKSKSTLFFYDCQIYACYSGIVGCIVFPCMHLHTFSPMQVVHKIHVALLPRQHVIKPSVCFLVMSLLLTFHLSPFFIPHPHPLTILFPLHCSGTGSQHRILNSNLRFKGHCKFMHWQYNKCMNFQAA